MSVKTADQVAADARGRYKDNLMRRRARQYALEHIREPGNWHLFYEPGRTQQRLAWLGYDVDVDTTGRLRR